MRLDKLLADEGLGTRSVLKKSIRSGEALVNGEVRKDPGTAVDPEKDTVVFRGRPVRYMPAVYLMLHKPAGVLTAARDKKAGTVMDLIPGEKKKGLYPVGRLDKDTEGLLLITNDGPLGHALLSPKRHVEKVYLAELSAPLGPADIAALEAGVDIGDEDPTLPARILSAEEACAERGGRPACRIAVTEGRFHQIKRMMQAVGREVTYLKRLSMGPLTLDPSLPAGEYRPLTEEEISDLIAAAGRREEEEGPST